MTQEDKFKSMETWLAQNHFRHKMNVKGVKPEYAQYMRTITSAGRVLVIVCPPDKEDELFKEGRRLHAHPLFVREKENVFFIIEKLKNALKGWNTKVAKEQEEKAKATANTEHKRTRIAPKVEKVNLNRVRAVYDVHCAEMAEKENQVKFE